MRKIGGFSAAARARKAPHQHHDSYVIIPSLSSGMNLGTKSESLSRSRNDNSQIAILDVEA